MEGKGKGDGIQRQEELDLAKNGRRGKGVGLTSRHGRSRRQPAPFVMNRPRSS